MGVGTAASLGPLVAGAEDALPKTIKIIAVACSPRAGKTTVQALGFCLEAAKAVDPERIETELIDLADMEIPGYMAAGVPLKSGHRDDFPNVAAKLVDRRGGSRRRCAQWRPGVHPPGHSLGAAVPGDDHRGRRASDSPCRRRRVEARHGRHLG